MVSEAAELHLEGRWDWRRAEWNLVFYLFVIVFQVAQYLLEPDYVLWPGVGFYYLLLTLGLAWHYVVPKKNSTASTVVDLLVVFGLLAFGILPISIILVLNLFLVFWTCLRVRAETGFVLSLLALFFLCLGLRLGWELTQKEYLSVVLIHGAAYLLAVLLSAQFSQTLQQTEKELSESRLSMASLRKLQSALLETMPIGEVSFVDDGAILQNNSAYAALLAQYKIELTTNFWDQFPYLQQEILLLSTDAELLQREVRLRQKDGRVAVFGLACRRLYSQEVNRSIWVFLLQDQTELRDLEAQLQQKEKLAAVGALAAGIAHEIRNPLTGMSGSIEMLKESISGDSEQRLMKIVLKEIDRLNHLITEFLDFAKPLPAPSEELDLSQVVEEVLQQVRLRSDNPAGLKIETGIQSSRIIGHRDKLKQAFLNVIVNAVQAMDKEAQPLLKVSCASGLVTIADNGCGMDEETRKRVFEPFFTRKPKGTGLGMAITYKILEMHQAEVEILSEVGVGTTFRFRFGIGTHVLRTV